MSPRYLLLHRTSTALVLVYRLLVTSFLRAVLDQLLFIQSLYPADSGLLRAVSLVPLCVYVNSFLCSQEANKIIFALIVQKKKHPFHPPNRLSESPRAFALCILRRHCCAWQEADVICWPSCPSLTLITVNATSEALHFVYTKHTVQKLGDRLSAGVGGKTCVSKLKVDKQVSVHWTLLLLWNLV